MIVNRRQLIAASGVALAGTILSPAISTSAATVFTQKKLPYDENALSPTISARTVGLHYGKHHAGYFKKLNQLVQNTAYADLSLDEVVSESNAKNDQAIFNQAAQAWNHDFYWAQFRGGPEAPTGSFKEAVEREFRWNGWPEEEGQSRQRTRCLAPVGYGSSTTMENWTFLDCRTQARPSPWARFLLSELMYGNTPIISTTKTVAPNM